MNNKYYVYAYLDPRKSGSFEYGSFQFTHEPFYIGKGKNLRCYDHLKYDKSNKFKINKINKIKKINAPIVIKIFENLNESEALEKEILAIKTIGRSSLKEGPLTNILCGGEISTETMFTRERGNRIANSQSGSKNHMFGKHHTEESKNKMRKKLLGRYFSEKTREKIRISKLGNKNYMFGKISPRRKLSRENHIEICKKYLTSNYSYSELSKEYNVSKKTIYNIINKKIYFNL